jgi:hypothetical protein
MNERIQQLAAEAGFKTNWQHEEVQAVKMARFEKFAQLIVAECLEACSRANEIRHFVPPGQQQVVLDCMREIETTFRS